MIQITNEPLPSILKDPFSKISINAVRVHYVESSFTEGMWRAYGTVSFKNGNTSGEQAFEGIDFNEIVNQIKIFIETIK